MAKLIMPGKKIKKRKTPGAEEVLEKLESYLNGNSDVPIEILCGFWEDQQEAITYQELREAVKAGYMNETIFQEWSKDYSVLVSEKLQPIWKEAMQAGTMGPPVLKGISYEFNLNASGVVEWIHRRGAEFVTAGTMEQREAIQCLLAKKVVERHTVDELSRLIRPCIGLTKAQAKANLRYYESIVADMQKEHPRMKKENIQKKAREAAAKYAEKQHRQHAMTVAQTEMAFAYNQGADEGIRQAQSENLLGVMQKRWSTSGDDAVCDICAALEGVEVGMEEEFDYKGRSLFYGHHMLPPAHPRCACAIEYIEISPPVF